MRAHATPTDVERLYRERFRAFVRAMAVQLGDPEAARDVVQEAFAAALGQLDTYRGSGPLEAWVWRIVVNTALDESRFYASRLPGPDLRETASYEANGHGGDKSAIRARLAALPPRQRLAVFLHYYADLDYATIASVLEIAPGTVAATLNAARASLRERLREERQ